MESTAEYTFVPGRRDFFAGELLVNDVFGLNGISEHEEQIVTFHVPFGVSDGERLTCDFCAAILLLAARLARRDV